MRGDDPHSFVDISDLLEKYPHKKQELLMRYGYKFAVIVGDKTLGYFKTLERAEQFARIFESDGAQILEKGGELEHK
ncbi:hypothetical protein [Fluviispira vulneris]|uniref:hypothetical protein n=1 Tax=Fluviispira vulneris TaxID=2763012 RepID=UPI0016497080|nr:hypothetical protein [Fluviispira vulneris]